MNLNDIVNIELYPKKIAMMKAQATQNENVENTQAIQDSTSFEDSFEISNAAMKLFMLSPSY